MGTRRSTERSTELTPKSHAEVSRRSLDNRLMSLSNQPNGGLLAGDDVRVPPSAELRSKPGREVDALVAADTAHALKKYLLAVVRVPSGRGWEMVLQLPVLLGLLFLNDQIEEVGIVHRVSLAKLVSIWAAALILADGWGGTVNLAPILVAHAGGVLAVGVKFAVDWILHNRKLDLFSGGRYALRFDALCLTLA